MDVSSVSQKWQRLTTLCPIKNLNVMKTLAKSFLIKADFPVCVRYKEFPRARDLISPISHDKLKIVT